ncbi:MAG: LysR family transcriptional regulator, partial [Hyphomicrobiales bacterium]
MSEIDDIRSFVAVVDAGGFGRAAHSLGVAKSIVSRRVA